MAEEEKKKITADDYLTPTAFARKHGLTDEMDLVLATIRFLHSRRIQIKTPQGNMVSLIYPNHKTHNELSRYKIPPFSEERVLSEINKRKGNEK